MLRHVPLRHRVYSTLSFGSGPNGVDGRIPLQQNHSNTDTSHQGITITDPYILYQTYIQSGILQKDESQLRAMKEFQKLYHRILNYKPPEELSIKISLLIRQIELKQAEADIARRGGNFSPLKLSAIQNLFRKDPEAEKRQLVKVITDEEELLNFASPHGLLVNGEVGCGKSMLMDIFASSLPHESKMRWHYNNFILWVYNEMHKIQNEKLMMATLNNGKNQKSMTMENEFVLFEIAQKMISKNTVLMLDEFMLPDIASANIIKILFTYYFKLGGILVATSNKLPEQLYSNEFHKSKFRTFVGILNARCQSIDMLSTTDYRTLIASVSSEDPNIVVKMDDESGHDKVWNNLIKERALGIDSSHPDWNKSLTELGTSSSFTVYNRTTDIPLSFCNDTICYLDFKHICQGLYSSSDYITLASRYRVVILDNVPIMTTKMKNEARRFITLLDAIYESKCQFYMRSDVGVDDLFFPDSNPNIREEIAKRLSADDNSGDRLEVQDEEMFAKTSIAMSNPYRPNVASYEDNMESYAEQEKKERIIDFKKTSAFTGEDEKFAYKRAVSRIKEMVNSDAWRSIDRWVPIDKTMRPWESLDNIRHEKTGFENIKVNVEGAKSVVENIDDNTPKIQGLHHFWAMGPWKSSQGKRLKDSIAKSWIRSSIRNDQ